MTSRLDAELVRRGLARSRAVAHDLIGAGAVVVDGKVAGKAAYPVEPEAQITVAGEGPRWVGRGGEKLAAALAAFMPAGLRVEGRSAADCGASTGGFSQVLRAYGASRVAAIDVGHGQLAAAVAADPGVVDYSGTSIRGLDPADVGGPVELVVADLSFISLVTVMPDLARLALPVADLVVLVKPQFEVGRERLAKTGVVRSRAQRVEAVLGVARAAAIPGFDAAGLMRSPLTGAHGNVEFLMWLRRGDGEAVGAPWQALEERAYELAGEEQG